MKHNVSPAVKIIGMMVFACMVSFFVYISFFVMFRTISTDVIGYTVYEITEDGKSIDLETLPEPPESVEENQGYREERSEMNAVASGMLATLQVVCGLGIMFCVVGSVLAKEAANDRNASDFKGVPYDRLRGLKIGMIAAIPSVVLTAIALVLRLMGKTGLGNIYYWVYRWIIMCPVKPINDLLTGNAASLLAAPVWSIAVQFGFAALLVFFCGAMYLICYNEDSIIAKLLYKSTKSKKNDKKRLGR